MQKEKYLEISDKLSIDRENYMDSLRKNLDTIISGTDFTIKGLAEAAGIPFSTLNNILYGSLSDCKVSTIVRLARALSITVDELLGCGTLSDMESYSLAAARKLPEHSRYLIKWFIRRQLELQDGCGRKSRKVIPVMSLEKDPMGNLHTTNAYQMLDITDLPDEKRPKIFLGMELHCDYYMPYYTPYDVLLIANDRKPQGSENSVIIYGNQIFVVRRKVVCEKDRKVAKYYNIRDGRFLVDEEDVDDVVGYVVHSLTIA